MARAAQMRNTVTANIRHLAKDLDQQFDREFLPSVKTWCEQQVSVDLAELDDKALIDLWQTQQQQVLDEFGVNAFLPSMVEALATSDLRSFLAEHIWDEEPDQLVQTLAYSPSADVTLRSNVALQKRRLRAHASVPFPRITHIDLPKKSSY